jgi:hypothetical protein
MLTMRCLRGEEGRRFQGHGQKSCEERRKLPQEGRSGNRPPVGREARHFNVNGVNSRLEVLLRWLEEAGPDVVCLQELKAPQEKFPLTPIEAAGYGAV